MRGKKNSLISKKVYRFRYVSYTAHR